MFEKFKAIGLDAELWPKEKLELLSVNIPTFSAHILRVKADAFFHYKKPSTRPKATPLARPVYG